MIWLPFLLKYWRIAAVGAGVLAVVLIGWRFNDAAYNRGVAAEAERNRIAFEMAVQERIAAQREVDRQVYEIGLAEVAAQRVIQENTRTIVREINTRVTVEADAACPVPLGFVRVFDAAASGDPTAGFAQRAPEPDDTATDATLSEIAGVSATALGDCHANSRQLEELQAVVRAFQAQQQEQIDGTR